jgi:phosphoglycerate kinase
MVYDFLTLDDVEVEDKTVFLRVDINAPLDPVSKRILDATRIKAVLQTLKELDRAKVVLGAHQSRPGKYDFTSLKLHTRVLQMYLENRVRFCEDILGNEARKSIKELEPGEILVLNNLRMLEEENKQDTPEESAKTRLVTTLSPYFDLAVNDAFAASHRSQPSLVGFGEHMPMVAGRLMEEELKAVNRVINKPDRPSVYVLGGAKVEDRIPVIRRVLKEKIADRILIGGLIRETFHLANLKNKKFVKSLAKMERKMVKEAADILEVHGENIEMPIDVALDVKGERVEIYSTSLMDETNVYDIGLNTMASFCAQVKKAGTVVAEGPLGMFERKYFNIGTKEVLRAMAESYGFTLVGGGHLGGLASMMDVDTKINHVSTGGGALLNLLAGEKMPVIEALVKAKKKHR